MEPNELNAVILSLAQRLGVIPGKKALQKLVYFLQEAEHVPLGLSFEMYHYGPYAQELEWYTREMEASRQLKVDIVDETFQIRPTIQTTSHPAVDRTLAAVGPIRPRELELMASLHYLANLRPYTGSNEDKISLKQRLFLWKGRKFSDYEVDSSIRKLESIEYLPKQSS